MLKDPEVFFEVGGGGAVEEDEDVAFEGGDAGEVAG